MPRKNVLERYKSVSAGSLGADLTSPVTNIKFLDNVLIELVCTGTPSGTFYVEVSNNYDIDNNGNVLDAGTWVALDLLPIPNLSGGARNIILDLNQLAAPFVRVRYVRSAGTGSLDMFISGKEV